MSQIYLKNEFIISSAYPLPHIQTLQFLSLFLIRQNDKIWYPGMNFHSNSPLPTNIVKSVEFTFYVSWMCFFPSCLTLIHILSFSSWLWKWPLHCLPWHHSLLYPISFQTIVSDHADMNIWQYTTQKCSVLSHCLNYKSKLIFRFHIKQCTSPSFKKTLWNVFDKKCW